jgi:membrane fusion protein, multidrug efflux system
MAQDTATPAPDAPPANAPRQDHQQAPLPASEKDLRGKRFNSSDPRFRLFLIIGGIVIVVAIFFLWRYLGSYESTDDAQVDGHLNSISARVSGHVAKLLVDDNQMVTAGQVLVEIDPSDYQIALEHARADYDDAVAAANAADVSIPLTSINTGSQISTADAGVLSSEAGIAAARQQFDAANAQLAQSEANNVRAQADLERYQQLVDKQEISKQQYDQAVAASKAQAAEVDAARASASAARQGINQAQAKLAEAKANARSAQTAPQQVAIIRSKADSARAQVAFKKAALDQAQLNLKYAQIIAPVTGIVTNRTVEVGQNVSIGQELMKVINLDDIWVTANFKETQLREMRAGQPVTIHVDATGRDYNGKVQSISGSSGSLASLLPPENATGNYVKVVQRIPVKITFDPGETGEHTLRPGMSVEPKVRIHQ